MTHDEELIRRGNALRELRDHSAGFQILKSEIDDRIVSSWEAFIDLPAEKKTGKEAFAVQGRYRALKDVLVWVDKQIKEAEVADRISKK